VLQRSECVAVLSTQCGVCCSVGMCSEEECAALCSECDALLCTEVQRVSAFGNEKACVTLSHTCR